MAFLFGAISAARAADTGYTSDPIDEVKAKVQSGKALLVDVREQREWDRGHVRSAVLLPLSQLMAWDRDGMTEQEKAALLKAVPKGSVIYCHCASGGRCLPGGELLRKMGYDARSLKPGYQSLINAGFPKESGR